MTPAGRRLKRAFDVVVAASVLVVAAPVLLVVALAIRWRDGPPVLFRQVRPGLGGELFTITKFRTLRPQPAHGPPLADAERLTPLGAFLRSTSLDELPALWNVLRGDMSLVGPRPLLPQYLPLYSPEQARRHLVLPGITGWAQVNGRNAISWERKFELDVWYVEHRSFVLDLKILAMTAAAVLRREGIGQDGEATTEEFRGS